MFVLFHMLMGNYTITSMNENYASKVRLSLSFFQIVWCSVCHKGSVHSFGLLCILLLSSSISVSQSILLWLELLKFQAKTDQSG